jgi:hypothetical protein
MGDIILIVDFDTVVPEVTYLRVLGKWHADVLVGLLDAVCELAECPEVAIISARIRCV